MHPPAPPRLKGTSRSAEPRRLPLRCGAELVGYVVITDCDNDWWLGRFEPGPGYERHRPLFDREQALRAWAGEAGDDDPKPSEAWLEALVDINQLGLRLGDPGELVRDFKIDDDASVELKLDSAADSREGEEGSPLAR